MFRLLDDRTRDARMKFLSEVIRGLATSPYWVDRAWTFPPS